MIFHLTASSCKPNTVAIQFLNIVGVQIFSDINVIQGTDFVDTGYPTVAIVTLDDDTTREYDIVWDDSTYNSMVAGTYNIKGTLTITDDNITNLSNKQPSISIIITAVTPIDRQIVSAASQPAITTPYNTLFSSLVLPTQVVATLDDSSSLAIDVTWSAGSYNATTPATYTLTATFVNLTSNVKNDSNIHPTKSVQVLAAVAGPEDGVITKKLTGVTNAEKHGQWLPTTYSQTGTQLYPVLYFLHGYGERDTTTGTYTSVSDSAKLAQLDKVLVNGPPKHIKNGNKMKFTNADTGIQEEFIVIWPQTRSNIWHPHGMNFIQWHLQNSGLRIDPDRVYVTGLSQGGMGCWESMASNSNSPNLVAAIVPICPGATPAVGRGTTTYNKGVKVWAFHALDDTTAVPYTTQRPINEIKALTTVTDSEASNVTALLPDYAVTYYTGTPIGHSGAWDRAYRVGHEFHNPNMYEWILTKRKA